MKLDHKTILLVDDDPLVAELYQKMLTAAGAKVLVARNGAEGLEKLKDSKVDLILLDLIMPEMNGLQMLRQVKADSKSRDLPVIILTNQADTEGISETLELGAKEYILKTAIEPKRLVDKIASYLG